MDAAQRPTRTSARTVALPAVPSGAHGVTAQSHASHAKPGLTRKPHWRAGMEEWLVAEQGRGGGSVANSRFRMGRHSTSSKALTPLRGLGRPQTTSLRTAGSDARRSKSADPGMSLSKVLPPTDTRPYGRTGWSNTASPGLLDSEVPLSRTKVLPLVSNRADREQVQDFYSELRQAAEAGRLRFEVGVKEREQQRQIHREF